MTPSSYLFRRRRPGKRRRRRGYVRRSRAKPKTGWTLAQLAVLSGIAARTIRMYIERGLVKRPPFLGSATRYQREQLVTIVAIRHLRATERLSLNAIRARLQSLSASDVEVLVSNQALAAPLASALGLPPVAPATASQSSRGTDRIENALARLPRWIRTELALGLELHQRDDASPEIVDLARRIREICAGLAQP